MNNPSSSDNLPEDLLDHRHRIRHSAAHMMAGAVLALYPDAKLGIGPPTPDGFYYDFLIPNAFTPEDLQAIEERMLQERDSDISFDLSLIHI